MGNVLFIVWRESLEAVLVIGILYSYIARQVKNAGALRYLYAGVGVGIALSAALAWATLKAQDEFAGRTLDTFQSAMLLFSAALMTQMVFWMNKHGRKLKASLESDLKHAMTASGLWGIALVAALAVAREGAETVIYLYGLALENAVSHLAFGLTALAGLVLALLTATAVSRGIRFLNYGTFFKVTSIVLLLSAAGLLVAGSNHLIALGLLPPLVDPLWNTSRLLDTSSTLGGLFASFTGYCSRPSLTLVVIYALYWAITLGWMKHRAKAA